MIPRRLLGSTALEVGVLGLGTVKLGRNRGVKYPAGFELPSDEQAKNLLAIARDAGVNLIDTAPAYGVGEERLGSLLSGTRDDWVIVTKAGETFENGRSRFDFSPAAIRASVERSLRRLRTDRVECLLLHSDGRDLWILEESGAIGELARLKDEGKILSTGISTKTPEGAGRAIGCCDVVMATLNLGERGELGAIRRCGGAGVGVLIKKALASGHAPSAADSLRFVLDQPGVACAVVGTINPEHLLENARIASELAGEGRV